MDDELIRLNRRIDSLTHRLETLESLLGVPLPGTTPPQTPPPPVIALPAEPPPLPAWVPDEPEPSTSLASTLLEKSHRAAPEYTEPTPPPSIGIATLESAAAVPKPRPAPRQFHRDIERLVGGRWYAVIGAIAVVIGICLFFKLGYDRGWFAMAPWARCAAGAVFGLALLGAGEWIRRKINDLAAAGAFSAGLGTIYASVYAAYRLYDLLPQVPAFILLAATALLGVFVAARTRLIFVAILSLTAGYLTPFLLASDHPRPLVLPAYLLMLLAIGLGVCAKMGRTFAPVRTLVWWATLALGALWEISQGISQGGWGAAFAAVVWVALHAELIYSAGLWGLQRGEGPASTDSTRPGIKRWSPLIASFSTTAWAVTFGALALKQTLAPTWIAPAAGLAAAATLASILAGGLRGLLDKPSTDSERLGACLFVQAAGLLFATIALALAGWAEAACWIALGLSAIVAARWLRARAFDIYGLGVLAFCVARLIVYDSWVGNLAMGGSTIAGLQLTSWTLLMAFAAAAWLAASRLILPRGEELEGRFAGIWSGLSDGAACVGVAVLGASLFHSDMSGVEFAGITVATATAAFAWGRGFKTASVVGFGVVVLSLATAVGALNHIENWLDQAAGVSRGLSLSPVSIVLICTAAAWAALSAMLRMWKTLPESAGGRIWGVPRLALSDFAACVSLTLLPFALVHPLMDAALVSVLFTLSGILAMLLSRQTRAISIACYAALLLVIGSGAALASRWWMNDGGWHALGLVLTRDAVAPLLSGIAWLILGIAWAGWKDAAGLSHRALLRAAPVASGIAAIALSVGLWHMQAANGWLALIPLVVGVACVAARKWLPPLRLELIGSAGLIIAGAGWLIAYVVPGWGSTDLGWILHPGLLVACVIMAAWVWVSCLHDADSPQDFELSIFDRASHRWRIAAVAFALVASSFEIARLVGQLAQDPAVRGAAVSIWWGLFAAALIGFGFWKRLALSRRAGLILLAIAALKALLLDLAGAPAGWRVASFIGLGLLMLGVAVVYQKMAARESPAAAEPPPNE